MSKTTIEWTDATWNPIRGTKGRWHCTHVSEGCRNCYAERLNVRWGGPAYKPGADTFRLDEKILEQPLHWKNPRKVFVCDMTDLFHEQIPMEWIAKVFICMAWAQQCEFQVLTKRPKRMLDLLVNPSLKFPIAMCLTGGFLKNVWLGVSVEDQATADERIPLLLQTPAAVRFVSYEPALGLVQFQHNRCWLDPFHEHDPSFPRIDWLIVGGESGPKARPCDVAWIRSAVQQCQAAKVPVFVKQLGSRWAHDGGTRWLDQHSYRLNRHSKGGDPSEWPLDLRVREFPN